MNNMKYSFLLFDQAEQFIYEIYVVTVSPSLYASTLTAVGWKF